jgi:hypothetical protein
MAPVDIGAALLEGSPAGAPLGTEAVVVNGPRVGVNGKSLGRHTNCTAGASDIAYSCIRVVTGDSETITLVLVMVTHIVST